MSRSFGDTATSAAYWERRAVRFAGVDGGLPAVCAYGMPGLYNRAIDACQRRALAPLLRSCTGLEVLDVGCGVGRWSLPLARCNRVVGVDVSPTMVATAAQRAAVEGLDASFTVADVTGLALGRQFDLVLCVTVLQHVLTEAAFDSAMCALAAHVKPSGRLVLLEAAPGDGSACDSPVFRARSAARFRQALALAGLELRESYGVDIAPFRPFLLPLLPKLPPLFGRGLVTAASLLSLPFDLLLSRNAVSCSWHKVLVAHRSGVP